MTAVFANTDGTDFPQSAAGWTVQSAGGGGDLNPGLGSPNPDSVFPGLDGTDRPDTVRGWTVQTSAAGSEGGSNQHLVGVAGV